MRVRSVRTEEVMGREVVRESVCRLSYLFGDQEKE